MIADKDLLNKLLPYQSNYISVAGYKMHYLDEGIGPVVLLLHGNPTWCFYYRNLLERLKSEFRVIVPDFIGMGLSERPKNAHFRASKRIDHIDEFVEKLGLNKYSLVMHDWGGSIGTGHAVRFPERIEKLVYLNTTLTETESLPLLIKTAASPIIGKYLTRSSKRFLKFTTKLGVAKKLPKDVVKGYYYPYKTRNSRNAIWDFVADIPFDSTHPSYTSMLELAKGIPKLQHIPTLIVWGLKDPCFHREMLNKVAEHFPHAEIVEIPNASHLVLEDAPEICNERIYDFFKGVKNSDNIDTIDRHKINPLYKSFFEQVRDLPQTDAVIKANFLTDTIHYAKYTFSEMASLIYKYERGLSELGLERNDKVLMLVTPGVNFLALSLAIIGRGATPVFLDPGMGREKLLRCIKELKPDAFIGSAKAQVIRVFKKSVLQTCKFSLIAEEWFGVFGPDLSYLKKFAAKPLGKATSAEIALLAYTSGATGTPKGVVFTDAMLQAQLEIFKNIFGLEANKKDLPLLPIFSLFTIALGVTSVFPPMNPSKPLNLDPQKIVRLIHDHQINYSFGSPTLWKKIGEYCLRSLNKLHSIEKIFIAGAPVPVDTIKMLQELMTKGEVFTPYGATEALPVTFVKGAEIIEHKLQTALTGEQGTFVGKPIPGITLKVIKEYDGELNNIDQSLECKPYEIGEIIVAGANVSTNYFERIDADIIGKIQTKELTWHRMGDVGYLDDQGNLYFCGRKAHVVRISNSSYYSVPIERIFNQHQKVHRSALVSLGNDVGIVVEPYPQYWPQNELEREHFVAELISIGKENNLTKNIQYFFFHQSFPVDGRHNAKIFRDQLGVFARNELNRKLAA